jgi:Spy/CpxP family protein refolding chaperone
MNKTFCTAIWVVFLFGAVTLTGAAAADIEGHPPGAEQGTSPFSASAPDQPMPGMMKMMQNQGMMEMMGPRPCMDPSAPSSRLHMMGGMLSGRMSMDPARMQHMMEREFFLDRAEELNLTAEQVDRLGAIRNTCRKENIRTGAEARIARMDLDDLLSQKSWSIKEAEKLVRQMQTLEGDMLVRHLQAVTEARKVLTADQLKKAESGSQDVGLKELFE